MIFKLNIEGNELYFSQKSNNKYSKEVKNFVLTTEEIYPNEGEYEEIYKVLTKIFTEYYFVYQNIDNIDVQFVINESYHVITYWGDVEVSNEYNETHLMKGVYIEYALKRNMFDKNKYNINSFEMFRNEYHPLELKFGYMFSHCRAGERNLSIKDNKIKLTSIYKNFQRMCLGSSELEHITNNNKTLENTDLSYVFLIIDSFIRWESINGGPYIQLVNIYNNLGIYYDERINITDDLILTILKQKDIKFNIDNSKKLHVTTESIISICSKLELKTNIKSRFGNAYDSSKTSEYEGIKQSYITSNVMFNGEKVRVYSKPLNLSVYQKHIDNSFKLPDTSMTNSIQTIINKYLSKYSLDEEPEYEILNN